MARTETAFKVATVDELQDIDYRQGTHMRPVRHHLGITAFGTNAWTAASVGDRLMPEHEEDEGSEELYVVLRGRARFEIGGDTVDAPEGTLVFVRPQTSRTAFAEEAGTTVLAVGSTVGQPYHLGGWEVWAPFHPQYEAGEYDAVIDGARETLDVINPYVTDRGMIRRIVEAAQRGAQVRMFVPANPNNWACGAAEQFHHRRLLDAGVRIRGYPTMLHAKAFVADGEHVVVGTCNLEAWSLKRFFEIDLGFRSAELVAQFEERFFAPAEAVSVDLGPPSTLKDRTRAAAMAAISPLL